MKYSAIAVIYNPNSTGSSEATAKTFKKDLQKHLPGQSVELIGTEYPGHADKIAYDLATATKRSLVISSSGDGGYHEVINGILRARKAGYDATAGLLPAGNANDHYRNIHSKDIINMIVDGERGQIDVLKLQSKSEGKRFVRYAHSYIGFGMTPIVGQELNKTKLNVFNQVWIVGKALLSLKAVKLIIDRKPHYYDSVIFSNIDTMSKVLKISQPSRVNDGKFEVAIFQRKNKFKFISYLLKASTVGIKEDKQVKRFVLKTVHHSLVQLDGEIMTIDPKSKVVVTAEKRALFCIV